MVKTFVGVVEDVEIFELKSNFGMSVSTIICDIAESWNTPEHYCSKVETGDKVKT